MIDGTPFSDFGARAEVTVLLANTNSRAIALEPARQDPGELPARQSFLETELTESTELKPVSRSGNFVNPVNSVRHHTDADWREAEEKAELVRQFIALLARSYSGNQAAYSLGKPHSFFSGENGVVALYKRGGVAALLPKRRECGAKPTVLPVLPAWFIPSAKYFYLMTNRTWKNGSTPEALRRTISLPHLPTGWTHKEREKFLNYLKPFLSHRGTEEQRGENDSDSFSASLCLGGKISIPECPLEIRETILARQKLGQPLLPFRLLRQITSGEIAVRSHRGPRDAWLRYVQSPGSLMLTIDELSGFERYITPGEVMTIDDGTKNFPCCVPGLQKPGDKCFDKWGVMAARFQFILTVDHATGFITGFNHTARPRGSYRAEDLTAAMQVVFMEHGKPAVMVMEKGISASNLVTSTLSQLGIRILRASSPHQKVVENVFNKLWTKLSVQFPNSDVGRYMGDQEEASRRLEACRSGAQNPRQYFPEIGVVVQVLREVIAEHNATTINSRYGRWIPSERFGTEAHKVLTPLTPESAWMFSPSQVVLKLNNSVLKTTVQFLPGYSQKFAFNAMSFANEFFGASVKLFFNPFANCCTAKVVLDEAFNGHPKGMILGDAIEFDREAKFARRWLQYSDEEDNGRAVVRANAQAVHRFSQAVRANGGRALALTEARNGNGESATVGISREVSEGSEGREEKISTSQPSQPSRPSRETLLAQAEETRRFEEENAHLFL